MRERRVDWLGVWLSSPSSGNSKQVPTSDKAQHKSAAMLADTPACCSKASVLLLQQTMTAVVSMLYVPEWRSGLLRQVAVFSVLLCMAVKVVWYFVGHKMYQNFSKCRWYNHILLRGGFLWTWTTLNLCHLCHWDSDSSVWSLSAQVLLLRPKLHLQACLSYRLQITFFNDIMLGTMFI